MNDNRGEQTKHRGFLGRLLGIFALCSAATLQTNPACAQAASPTANQANAAGSNELTEIIVTAQRRTENLQDVPISISVLKGEDLGQTNYRSITDLQYVVPGLEYDPSNGGGFQVRGVGTQSFDYSSEQGVSVVVDDVVVTSPRQSGLSGLTDVEQVEVLRGPQGTLFGKNSTAGVVSISTKKPVLNDFSAYFSADYGEDNDRLVNGTVNLPIGTEMALRVNAFGQGQDGYGRYTYLGKDLGSYRDNGVRARLFFQPTDDLQVLLNGNYGTHWDNQALTLGSGTPTYVSTSAAYGTTVGSQNVDSADQFTSYTRTATWGTSLNINYDFGGAALTSISAFTHATQTANVPINFIPTTPTLIAINFNYISTRTTSQELRLASTGTNFIDYIGGLYFNNQQLFSTQFSAGDLLQPLPPGVELVLGPGIANFNADNRNEAAYGQAKFNFTDRLHLSVGARYTKDDNSQGIGAELVAPPSVYIPTGTLPTVSYGSEKKDNFSFRVSPQYQITPDVMTYATYSTGYKGPGVAFVNNVYDPYLAETVKSAEVGIKSELLEHRLRLNADIFYEKFSNFQAQIYRQLPFPGEFLIGNAGGLKSEGVETDFDYRLNRSFSVSGTVAYDEAVFTNYIDGPNDYSGDRLTNAPLWSWSLMTKYTHSLGDGYRIDANANYDWRSATDTVIAAPYSAVSSYGILGARIGVSPDHGKWHFGLYGRNLLNKFFFQSSVLGAGVGVAHYNTLDARRTIGGFVDYSF